MADDECPKVECPAGSPLWMCTFADLMSLLLCFFVLLLSFSVMDSAKYKKVAGSMENAFGIQRENRVTGSPRGSSSISLEFKSTPLAVKIQQAIEDEVSEESKDGQVETEFTAGGILVRMKDAVAFESGKAMLSKRAHKILDTIGKIISGAKVTIAVGGHTDNVPLRIGGKFSSNWSLSTARSVAVVEYWTSKYDIPSDKITAVGYADGQPLASNDTSEGRSKNRRVEFRINVDRSAGSFAELKTMLEQ